MTITFPKPNLLKPKIPGLVALGLLAFQYLLFGPGAHPEPKCILNVERPHKSTYLSEYRNVDAIKLNITSKCNVPQEFTTITANIQKIENNLQVSAYKFNSVTALPKDKTSSVAIFENLFVNCTKGKAVLYLGTAKGRVYLKNGQKYPVSGSSDKFIAVECQIGAK